MFHVERLNLKPALGRKRLYNSGTSLVSRETLAAKLEAQPGRSPKTQYSELQDEMKAQIAQNQAAFTDPPLLLSALPQAGSGAKNLALR